MLTKAERLLEVIRRLEAASPASSADEAFELMASILNAVEDELTGIPYAPDNWRSDGRMYPPQDDAKREVPEMPGWTRYRNRAHVTLIGPNGEIRIDEVSGKCLLNKPGPHGPKIGEQ